MSSCRLPPACDGTASYVNVLDNDGYAGQSFAAIWQMLGGEGPRGIAQGSTPPDARQLVTRARDALLTEALLVEEDIEEHKPADDLLSLEGMDEATAYALAARGVATRDDLAELATDEITDIEGMDEERAAKLIMAARAHWFE